ncbi:MAG: hypothetical protein GVY20_11180 [Bacteroidetes bacterium]|nr:hypothetical protein [Bacteroidota bacterium]
MGAEALLRKNSGWIGLLNSRSKKESVLGSAPASVGTGSDPSIDGDSHEVKST